jgi:OOP family OmpA-OmpF porin
MKKTNAIVLSCLGLVALASSPFSYSYVGNRPGAATLTLGGGYFYLSQKHEMNNKGGSLAELAYDFTEHWGIEAMLAVFNTHFKPAISDNRQVSGTYFAFDGIYHFLSDNKLQPYLLAGVGITGLSPNRYNANNSGNANAALGLQYFLNKTFALRVEARDFYTWVGGVNDVFLNAGVSATVDFC